jgi:peptidoglycan DL-endopeptidase CwlO
MHRAKHRAAGRAGADVLVTTLIERLAVDAGAVAPRGGVAVLDAGMPEDRDLGDAGLYGVALFGATTPTDPFLAVPDDEPPARAAAPLFHDDDEAARSPFGACRHAAPRPVRRTAPSVPAQRVRSQPVGTALTVTILGAAAVTAVVSPPVPVESTGELPPVQGAAPAPAPEALAAPAVAAPVAPEQPTMQVAELVGGVTAEMQKLTPAVGQQFTTVANKTEMSAAAARKAAVSKALSKLGTPYRWGAMGPNAFDCSGLVKWSFAQAGKSLPRTSRAQASAGTPVSKANLQPGDLVFFYKPISHVGIYIGNGKIVHASRKGQPVKVSDMGRMKFTKAVRL